MAESVPLIHSGGKIKLWVSEEIPAFAGQPARRIV
jgi:hypothetical protein